MAKGIPSRFGQCEVKEKLGEGAMATVYLGEHAGLQIPVAIKVPRFLPNGDLLEDEQYSSRFMREAQLAARLHHPNIVRVYDAGEQDGCYFMVLQYVDGPTVKDKLDEWECFLWHEAVPIILAICEGLQYAVDKGVIHRDIKPDNIMIDSNGVPLLMDLGLAKGDAALGAHLTQSSDVLGTPFYMSPEQIRDPRETDLRADIYSLGATLYHMICGDPPFGGTSIYDVMNRHMREPLISPRERAPDVPQALCDIIAKMMAKERDDRYQDYSLLIADLEHSLAGEGIVAQGAADLLQTQEKTKGPGLTETRAEQRYRPSRLPSTFLAPVAGVYALLCALALIAGMLLLFQGLRSSLGAVAAWVFAVSVLTLYAAYTVRLARNEGQALESDQQEARGSLLRGVLERLTGGLGLPMPQLYVTGGSTPLSLGYVFSFGRSVLKVSRGFLDALPEEDEMAETLALREIGRLCYGHSTVSALLDGPLRLFAGIVSPIQCLLYRRVGEKRPAARAGLLAAALAALAAIGTLVALLLHVWLWAGLAAGLFLAAGLLGQAVRRHAEYTADLFASAVLGDQWPVKCLIARQALLLPAQAKLLRQTIATDAAQPSPDDETTSATPVDGDEAKQAISHFSRTRSAGGSADWLHELLTGEPAAALRISALSGLGGGRSTRHKLLGRLLVVLGGFIGYARARRELPVPEPVRVRPYVLLGVAGGLLMGAGGVFLVPEAPSVRLGIAGYFAFASAVCAMALVLGAANVFVFRTQKGSRAEFAWSVLVSVFCYVLAGMTAIVAFGGSTGASTGLIMLTMFFPACVCAGAAAAVWARLRPLPRSRAAPQTPQGAAEQAPDKADNPDKAE